MISTSWKSIRRYLTVRSVGTAMVFVALAHLGLLLENQLAALVATIGIPGVVLITDANIIYILWMGLLSVHAAVGAVAPILGYTLMATTITAASRIAPSGAVVAVEIEWSNYLQTSLLLLAGSAIGALSAPSALGLATAGCVTTYVVVRTALVFKKGFELIERPEKFDEGARKYLTKAIANVPLAPPSRDLERLLENLNASLASRFPRPKESSFVRPTLRIGDQLRATQLLSIEPRSADVLASEAEKYGCQLFFVGLQIPNHLPRGARDFLEVQRVERVEASVRDIPAVDEGVKPIEQAVIEKLQQVLESSVVFGSSQWVDDFTRLPMLVQRHIATVVYESIPRQQPHDLMYGLDVLGHLVDQVQSKHGDNRPFDLDIFDWVYDIPQFVCSQIEEAPQSNRMIYARELVGFLRARLSAWLPDPTLDNLSRAYIGLLARILRSFMGTNDSGVEYMATVIREIPAMTRGRRIETIVLVQRSLILLLVEDGKVEINEKDRRLLIRTMAEVLRYSPGFDKDNVARAETVISAVAVSLFLSNRSDSYRDHLADVIEILLNDRYSESPFFELILAIHRVSEINERWRWSWWELDQKERGRAHFMSMEIWLTRAAMVALSIEGWKLSRLDDSDLPDQQVLGAMLRAVNDEGGWISLLPEQIASAVRSLSAPLSKLLERRNEIVSKRIAAAPLDRGKIERYVKESMADIRATFGNHNLWLTEAGSVRWQDLSGAEFQAGSSRLLPREWFVPDDALDIPIMLTGSSIGRALVDFELSKLAGAIASMPAEMIEVPNASDSRIWERVKKSLGGESSHLLIIGAGVSEYDVYEELSLTRKEADAIGVDLRFETTRSSDLGFEGILVLDPAKVFNVVRLRAQAQGEAIYEEVQSLEDGGVVCGIAEISAEMRSTWLEDEVQSKREELEDRYAQSVLDRTAWSFRVELLDLAEPTFFRIPTE